MSRFNRSTRQPRSFKQTTFWRIVALLLVGVATLIERFFVPILPREEPPRATPSHRQERTNSRKKIMSDTDQRPYEQLKDPRIVYRSGNDGDSYRIRHADGEDAFRLYFVDTPETNPEEEERLRYQSRYFGRTPEEMVVVGKAGRELARRMLQDGRFEVITRWEQVMDGPRYHAFIRVGDRFFHEILVEAGLARIYTLPADLPDGTSKEKHLRYLKSLEADAKEARRGAWGNVKSLTAAD